MPGTILIEAAGGETEACGVTVFAVARVQVQVEVTNHVGGFHINHLVQSHLRVPHLSIVNLVVSEYKCVYNEYSIDYIEIYTSEYVS